LKFKTAACSEINFNFKLSDHDDQQQFFEFSFSVYALFIQNGRLGLEKDDLDMSDSNRAALDSIFARDFSIKLNFL
jgi:hypothetical protein